MVDRSILRWLTVACLMLMTACGGGGSGSNPSPPSAPAPAPAPLPPPPPPPPPAGQPSFIQLESDAGDYIGGGLDYNYTKANAEILVTADRALLTIQIAGDESWSGDFQLPDSYSELQPGSFSNLGGYPAHDPAVGGLRWSGEGRGCSGVEGWVIIDSVSYDGATLTAIDLQFEQRCPGRTAALHGRIHWDASDTTSPPGPVVPPPAGLWKPAAGVTPASGNFIYLESQPGDYIGAGGNYLYTLTDSLITVFEARGRLSVSVSGNEGWSGDFRGMMWLSRLEPGYYGDLRRFPFHNPVKGGLSWSGEGRGCNALSGWFVVDNVTYDGESLATIDLRFEQHCEGGGPALHGAIHWDATDSAVPPGPVEPPPAGLWQPAAGNTPATGNYVYLESEPGDFIGLGEHYLYTLADSVISASSTGASLRVSVTGDERWTGDFRGMNSLGRLEVGYYGELQRYPFHNPAKGGMSWIGEGRACNELTGWLVVDNVTYDGSTLLAFDLRFEQHCEGGGPALHGAIHWDVNDATVPPGPIAPPPAGLWQPADGVTPASGNFVYLESQPGEYIGAGGSYLYTPMDSQITVNSTAAWLNISIRGDEDWSGDFQGMNTLSRLEAGYYGDLMRHPFHNPVKGGLTWVGEGRGCNRLTGWFVVDSVTYDGSTLTAIDLRFELHCEGAAPALHGAIHWSQ